MKSHFAMMADYNAWANGRLYRMASRLPDEQYRRDVGAYFKSLHGTLNHIMCADLIWMRRLTGAGEHPTNLDAIVFDDFPSLSAARQQEDQRIIAYVESLSDAQMEETWAYRTLNGTPQKQRRREILAHLFNHQTHHRGQAHAILTVLGVCEPDGLDLLLMQWERGYRENTPRCGFSSATGSLLPVFSGCTGEQVASGTQTESVIIESTSCCRVSIGGLPSNNALQPSAAETRRRLNAGVGRRKQ